MQNCLTLARTRRQHALVGLIPDAYSVTGCVIYFLRMVTPHGEWCTTDITLQILKPLVPAKDSRCAVSIYLANSEVTT